MAMKRETERYIIYVYMCIHIYIYIYIWNSRISRDPREKIRVSFGDIERIDIGEK